MKERGGKAVCLVYVCCYICDIILYNGLRALVFVLNMLKMILIIRIIMKGMVHIYKGCIDVYQACVTRGGLRIECIDVWAHYAHDYNI